MYIEEIKIEGLSDLPQCHLQDLESIVLFEQATPQSTALADAISLWFASVHSDDLVELLVNWEWGWEDEFEVHVDLLPEQLFWNDGMIPSSWVEENAMSVWLKLRLDPEHVGLLRKITRNPSVLIAVMEQPTFAMRVSVLFNKSHQGMAISFHDMSFGNWEVPIERPQWIYEFLPCVRGGFFRNYDNFSVAEMAFQTMLSIGHFQHYEQFQEAALKWGKLRVAMNFEREPMLLIDDRPIQRFGYGLKSELSVLASIYLVPSAILWLDWIPDDIVLNEITGSRQIFGVSHKGTFRLVDHSQGLIPFGS